MRPSRRSAEPGQRIIGGVGAGLAGELLEIAFGSLLSGIDQDVSRNAMVEAVRPRLDGAPATELVRRPLVTPQRPRTPAPADTERLEIEAALLARRFAVVVLCRRKLEGRPGPRRRARLARGEKDRARPRRKAQAMPLADHRRFRDPQFSTDSGRRKPFEPQTRQLVHQLGGPVDRIVAHSRACPLARAPLL